MPSKACYKPLMGNPDTKKTTILLVEDEAIIALEQGRRIASWGYEVLTAHNGEEAVRKVDENPGIGLILMDIDLGRGMDGTQAAAIILRGRDLPIVFLTSHSEPEMVERVRNITRYGYVLKNSGDFVLRSSIEMALELFEAHRRLSASEEKYRLLAENSTDVIWTMDLTGRFTYISPSITTLAGFTPEEAMEIPMDRYLEKSHAGPIMEELAAELAKHPEERLKSKTVEVRHYRKDGSVVDVDVTVGWLTDSRGEVVGIQGSTRDITARVRDRQALAEKEKMFSLALDAVNDGLWDWNLITSTAYFSPRYYTMLGYEPQEFPGSYESWRSLVHPDEIDFVEKRIGEAIEKGLSFDEEFRLKTKTGTWKWILGRGRVMERDTEGKPLRMIGTHVDIDDIKSAREALRESEEVFRVLSENSSDVIMRFDGEHHHLYVNPAVTFYTGMEPHAFIGKTHRELGFPDDLCSLWEDAIDKVLLEGGLHRVEFQLPSGHWIDWLLAPELDASGTVKGVMASARDITERKKREELIEEHASVIAELILREDLFSESLGSSLKGITEAGASVLKTERTSVWLYRDNYSRIECADLYHRTSDFHSPGEVLLTSDFPMYTASHRQGKVIAAADVLSDPRTRDIPRQYFISNDIRSLLDAPVWVRGRLVALLSFEHTGKQREWTAWESQIAMSLAAYVSLCIEADEIRRAEEEMSERNNEIEALNEQLASTVEELESTNEELQSALEEMEASNEELIRSNEELLNSRNELEEERERLRQSETETGKLLLEKEVLLREVHHRIKNNMSAVASLLGLQAETLDSPESSGPLYDARSRVIGMMSIYEKLYRSGEYRDISLREFIIPLVADIARTYGPEGDTVKIETAIGDLVVPTDLSFPIGIIINELVTNAFKYAFPDGKKGLIRVLINKGDGQSIDIAVHDDGAGLPGNFDINNPGGFGLTLVNILIRQVGGNLSIIKEKGTEFRIIIPRNL